MMRTIYTLVAMAAIVVATNAQTTQYRLSAITSQQWDGAIWLNTDSTAYSYAYGEVDTLVNLFTYNSLNATWDQYSQNITTYDAEGNETQNLRLVWDGAAFINNLKWDFTYDAQNLLTNDLRYNWDGTDWVPYSRTTYTYNAQGQTLTRFIELYASGSWANNERSLYAYTNGLLDVFETQVWTSGIWQKEMRNVYSYDTSGNVIKKLGQTWIAPAYQNNYMYLYTFDANNNMLTDAYIDWVSGAWDSISRKLYSYNATNEVDTVFSQLWDDSSPSSPRWRTEERDITLYNSQGLPDTLKHQEYLGLAYIGDKIVTSLEYDTHGNNTVETTITREWDGSMWVFENESKRFYYYEGYVIAGIAQEQQEIAVTAYPNPFAEKLCFALPTDARGPLQLTLFDMAGRRVLQLSQNQIFTGQQLTIDAGNIPSGQYIYQLVMNGQTAIGLVVK